MTFRVFNTQPIEVTLRDGTIRIFPDKESIINHLTNKSKGLENCIAHYEKELVRLKAELAPVQKDLALAETMILP